MARLKSCPFCKDEVAQGFPYLFEMSDGEWVYSHCCKHPVGKLSVTIDVYGNTEQEVIDKWNGVYEDKES